MTTTHTKVTQQWVYAAFGTVVVIAGVLMGGLWMILSTVQVSETFQTRLVELEKANTDLKDKNTTLEKKVDTLEHKKANGSTYQKLSARIGRLENASRDNDK